MSAGPKKARVVFDYERDPKDEPYINLAVAADARYLVIKICWIFPIEPAPTVNDCERSHLSSISWIHRDSCRIGGVEHKKKPQP